MLRLSPKYQAENRGKSLRLRLAITSGIVFLCHSAAANQWEFSPKIGVSQQFTDNARSSATNEESDFITSIDLGFSLKGETRRSEVNLSYDVSQDYYARNHDLDGYRQNFLGEGSLELIEEKFFIDARATFTEETLGTSDGNTAGNRTQADGRTQVFNGRISPYFVQDFAGWATGVARYSYSETIFSDPNVGASSTEQPDRSSNEIEFSLTSGRRFVNTTWGLSTGLLASESDDGDQFNHYTTIGTGQMPINRLFSIIGTVGYDHFDADNIDDDDISGVFAGAGIRFHPSTRTDASFQVGKRFDDVVFDVDVSYAPTSADFLTMTYRESIQTADQSLANVDILDEQGELVQPNFTVTDYVDDVTKTKRFAINWTRNRGRNGYRLGGNFVDREFLSTNDGDTVLSVNAGYDRQLTPRADLSLSTSYSETLDGSSPLDEDKVYRIGANYSYNFGKGLSGSIVYNFLHRDEAGTADLTENSLSLSINKRF